MPQWAQILQGVSGGVAGYYGGSTPEGTPPAYPAGSASATPAVAHGDVMRYVLIGGGVLGAVLIVWLVLKK